MEPAVFLDRDNTLIVNSGDLGDPEQVRLRQGVTPGLKALRDAGFRLAVVTNQGGVARGRLSEEDVHAVNERIAALIAAEADGERLIDGFYYCPYHPEGTVARYRREHPWRKPRAGMLLQAARDLGLDLPRSWMIGDQARDVIAGQTVGCRTVLLTESAEAAEEARPTEAVRTFPEAVQRILQRTPNPRGSGRPKSSGTRRRPKPARPGDENHSRKSTTAPVAEAPRTPRPPGPAPAPNPSSLPAELRRAINELVDELRSQRQHRAEFTALRMAAWISQLAVLLLALLGLLQIENTDAFVKWMAGAALLQLVTITILLVDFRG